ncbi:carbamoyltransferase C-terminal domain-containing protein [Streptomyces sp. NBC_01451]
MANPKCPDIKEIIDERIKHREQFRPFAPWSSNTSCPTSSRSARRSPRRT